MPINLIYLIHFELILHPSSGDPVILDPVFPGNRTESEIERL